MISFASPALAAAGAACVAIPVLLHLLLRRRRRPVEWAAMDLLREALRRTERRRRADLAGRIAGADHCGPVRLRP